MGYGKDVQSALRDWLDANKKDVVEALKAGGQASWKAAAQDSAAMVGESVAATIALWLEANKADLVDAVAGQFAYTAKYKMGVPDGSPGEVEVSVSSQAPALAGGPEDEGS